MSLEADLSDGAVPEKPKPGHVWFPRAQWDRYFVPGVLMVASIGLWEWWSLGKLRAWLFWLLWMIVTWAILRWGTPRQALMPAVAPKSAAQFWWLVVWFSAGVAGMLAMVFLPALRELLVRLVRPSLILPVYCAGWVLVWWMGAQLIQWRFRNPEGSCEVPAGDLV